VVDSAEAIIDQPFVVHEKGFVRLVDYMGGDVRIVQAARVSYGEGTKSVRDDAKLIHYLMKNDHTSPFEQVILTFHCKMPLFVARQWLRHRTARVNEISGRYSIMPSEFYLPAVEDIALQSSSNKQGRGQSLPLDQAKHILQQFEQQQATAYQQYQQHLTDQHLAKELARIALPLSLYTEIYWQIDLHNLFHFLQLRLHSHAQKEIRDYAQVLYTITQAVAPVATEAFQEHRLHSLRLSTSEQAELQTLLQNSTLSPELHQKLYK
jgi:thymidylate synthase (FAD)